MSLEKARAMTLCTGSGYILSIMVRGVLDEYAKAHPLPKMGVLVRATANQTAFAAGWMYAGSVLCFILSY